MDGDPYTLKGRLEKVKTMEPPKNFESWDPMKEDYDDTEFNRYSHGPGKNMSRNEAKMHELYVTGIPIRMTEEGLKHTFSDYGTVRRCVKMVQKRPDLYPDSTFGFVAFETVKEASNAISALDNRKYNGGAVVMKVQFALTEKQREEKRKKDEYHRQLMAGIGEQLHMPESDSASEDEKRPLRVTIPNSKERGEGTTIAREVEHSFIEDKRETKPEPRSSGHQSSGYNSDAQSSGKSRDSPEPTPSVPQPQPPVSPSVSIQSQTGSSDDRKVVEKGPSTQSQNEIVSHQSSNQSQNQVVSYRGRGGRGGLRGVAGRGGRRGGSRGGRDGGIYQQPGQGPYFQQPPGGPNMGGPYGPPPIFGYPINHGFNQGYGSFSGYQSVPNFMGQQPFRPFTPDYSRPPPQLPFGHYNAPPVQPDPAIIASGPIQPGKIPGVCEVCGKEAKSRCSNCRNVWYCSEKCQDDDWRSHKPNCDLAPPLEYVSTPERAGAQNYRRKDAESKQSKECVFFRGQGCSEGDKCRFLHIPENKGIEKDKYDFKDSCDDCVENGLKKIFEDGADTAPPKTLRPARRTVLKRVEDTGRRGRKITDYRFSIESTGECFYWRTTGCRNLAECKYEHKPESKGIDHERFQRYQLAMREVQERKKEATESKETTKLSVTSESPKKPKSINPRPAENFEDRFVIDLGSLDDWDGEMGEKTESESPLAASSTRTKQPQKQTAPKSSKSSHAFSFPNHGSDGKTKSQDTTQRSKSPKDTHKEQNRSDFGGKSKSPVDKSNRSNSKSQVDKSNRSKSKSPADNSKSKLPVDKSLQKSGSRKSATDSEQRMKKNSGDSRTAVVGSRTTAESLKKETLTKGCAVQVTDAHGPNDFWLVKEEHIQQITKLTEAMTKAYSKSNKPYKPIKDEIVAARFAADGQWYRACVNAVQADGSCNVHFVDYGNHEVTSQVQRLDEKFCTVHIQAVQCELGVNPYDALGVWTDDAKNFIATHLEPLNKKYILGSIQDSGEKKLVNITDKQSGQNLTEMIVGRGFATLRAEVSDIKTRKPSPAPPALESSQRPVQQVPSFPTPPPPPLKETPLPSQLKRGLWPNDKKMVQVTEIVSPSQFWVNIDCHEFTQLKKLQHDLQPYYEKKPTKKDFRPSGNNLYAAKSRDNTWYRALGYGDDLDTATVSMLFLDTGKRENIPFTRIHNLDSEFCSLPFQAVCCSVANLVPSDGSDKWSEEDCKKFRSFLNQISYIAHVVEKDDVRAQIDLLSNGQSLRQYMIQNGVGIAKPKPQMAAQVRPPASPLATLQHDETSSAFKSPPRTQRSASATHNSQSAAANTQTDQLAAPKIQTNQTESSQDKKRYETLTIGWNYAVGVYVGGTEDFYVHKCDAKIANDVIMQLDKEINESYNLSGPVHVPKIGDVVVVFYEDDSKWYRAVVLEIARAGVTVKFCDFGNTDLVSSDYVRKIYPRFVNQPWQAVPCCMYSVADRCRWSGKAIEKFEKLISDLVQLEVTEIVNGRAVVSHIYDSDGKDIVQHLIDNRFLKEENSGRTVAEHVSTPAAQQVEAIPVARVEQSANEISTVKAYRTELLPEDGAEVCISHINTPTDFYIQRSDKFTDFAQLAVNLDTECKCDAQYLPKSVGEVVAADFESVFCRAVVQTVGASQCEVFFIDYGNSANVSLQDIKSVPEGYMTLPAQAIHCGIKSIHGTEPNGDFPQSACDWFKEQVLNKPEVTLKYEGGEGDGTVKEIDLVINGNRSVLHELVGRGYATSTVEPQTRSLPMTSQVMVVEVSNSMQFYCHCTEDAAILKEVMLDVNTYCTETPADASFVPSKNEICAAKYKDDGMWYRARVTDVMSPKSVSVLFVDYGNAEDVDLVNIRRYKRSWNQYPFLAAKCRLDGLSMDSLAETAVGEFNALALNKVSSCTLVRKERDVHFVRLHTTDTDPSTDINGAIQALDQESPINLNETEILKEIERLQKLVKNKK